MIRKQLKKSKPQPNSKQSIIVEAFAGLGYEIESENDGQLVLFRINPETGNKIYQLVSENGKQIRTMSDRNWSYFGPTETPQTENIVS